jgi:uncharacterized membrane protein
MDTRGRSLIKAFSWRLVALVITTGAAWTITGNARVAASVGLLDTLLKLVTYYAHERIWNRINLGRAAAGGSALSSAQGGDQRVDSR